MGSIQVSQLDYIRSRTQIDWDSLSLDDVNKYGRYVDSTSNQAEVYEVITDPRSEAILRTCVAKAANLHAQFAETTPEELAFDICAVTLALRMAPHISGCVHLMANPRHTFNADKVAAHARRFHRLCELLDPDFDHMNRLIIKIACTWEGMQAARTLKEHGMKTMATTMFGMEQIALAGQAGCEYICIFLHELKSFLDETYTSSPNILGHCTNAQRYYESNGFTTRVKGCGIKNTDQLLQLAGLHAFTAMPNDLAHMAAVPYDQTTAPPELLSAASKIPQYPRYIDDEALYRIDSARSEGGLVQYKLMQAMSIFCDYQDKAEHLMSQTASSTV